MDTTRYDTGELKGLFRMNTWNRHRFSRCIAEGFRGYPLFEFVTNFHYDIDRFDVFWDMTLKSNQQHALGVADGPDVRCACILMEPGSKSASIPTMLMNGGISVIKNLGIKSTRNLLRFEKCADDIRRLHMTEDCWYLYAVATRPEFRGMGVGSKVLKGVFAFLDANGQDCYLETVVKNNVNLYMHYGFGMVKESTVPGTDLTIYGMVRYHEASSKGDSRAYL